MILPAIGDVSLTLDYAVTDVDDLGSIRRHGFAANWSPLERVRLQASLNKERLLPEAGSLGDPVTVTEEVRYFDVLTGETLDVIQITGGNPDLISESVTTRRLSGTAIVLPRLDLQLNAEYLSTRRSNPISTLPPTSADLMLAFPERFVRDAEGRLISVDVRPINFVRRASEQLRWGFTMLAPLSASPPSDAPVPVNASNPRLQITLSHTINLQDEIVARAAYLVVDLLEGGAIGFGGGGTRHLMDASANLSDRNTGLRLTGQYRGVSTLRTGTAAAPDALRFAPIFVATARAYTDLGRLLPEFSVLKETRLSVTITNVTNARQRVTDSSGAIPLRYQGGYRDPLGRTFEVEIRKMF